MISTALGIDGEGRKHPLGVAQGIEQQVAGSIAGRPTGTLGGALTRLIAMSHMGLVSRVTPVHTAKRNCTRDEGRPFEFGNQVSISSHRKLLSSKAMVVNVAETSDEIPAGMVERGERKRTAAEASK